MDDAVIERILAHPKYDPFRDIFDLHALAQAEIARIRTTHETARVTEVPDVLGR